MELVYLLAGATIFTLGMLASEIIRMRCNNVYHVEEKEVEEDKEGAFTAYEKRIETIRKELEECDIPKTPPQYTETIYDYTPVNKALVDDGVEIITNQYEKEYEKRILRK